MNTLFKLTLIITSILSCLFSFSQVAINEDNSNPDPSAMLDVQSIDKGVLVPRLTSGQRTTIASPANGLLVFDSTTESFWFYSSGAWTELIDRENTDWKQDGNNIYFNTGRVGIGTSSPTRQFHNHTNNGNLNTSPFLIDQAGSGDAFFNIGLTGSHHYNIGVDNSDGGKFKIGYNSTQPYGINVNTRFTLTSTGQVGIGTSGPSDRLQVDANAAESALRVRQDGATKLRIHSNGGTSIGVNSTPPVDGLLVSGVITPWGNIITDQNLLIESNGVSTFVQLQKNLSSILVDETGIYGNVQDNVILETSMENNKIEMNGNGLSASSDNNIVVQSSDGDITIESLQNNSTITIKAGSKEIIIDENGGITINSDGDDLLINSNGGNLTLDSGNGDITLDSGNGDINFSGDNMDFIASGTFDVSSVGAMLFKSTNSTLGLQSLTAMNLYSTASSITAQSSTNLKLNAGATLDLDGVSNMTLNAPTINLNNGSVGAAKLGPGILVNPVTGIGNITPTNVSTTVFIGN